MNDSGFSQVVHLDQALTSSLVELATTYPDAPKYLRRACSRADLSAADLDALHTRILRRQASTGGPQPVSPALWGLHMATHPNARADQRAAGRDLAASTDTADWGALAVNYAQYRELFGLAALTTDLDPVADPASPARVGARLAATPTTGLASAQGDVPGLVWLRQAAVDAYVTREDFADDATRTALLALAPTFPGTIGELIATARTLAR